MRTHQEYDADQKPRRPGNDCADALLQPTVRMQMDDPPAAPSDPVRPVALTMPSPAELGLGGPPCTKAIDWADVRRRLDRLGATGFDLQKLPSGFRVTFEVPSSIGQQRAQAEAADEADAIHRALAQIEVNSPR